MSPVLVIGAPFISAVRILQAPNTHVADGFSFRSFVIHFVLFFLIIRRIQK